MSALSVYAGPLALNRIKEEGLHAGLFDFMLGASGGPKWFILLGLDRFLFGEFFSERERPLYTLGSSAGAWRLACLASVNPVATIDRLAQLYSHEKYSARPDIREITDSAERMVRNVFSDEDLALITRNPVFRTHIIANRGTGIAGTRNAALQALHLGLAATLNGLSRRSLSLFFHRCLFSPDPGDSPWKGLDDLHTEHYGLSEENIFKILLATGSIPFVLEAVRNIPGAAPGVYWDGGITDYHLDVPCRHEDGLVLYPHFSSDLIPGWFDKKLPWRSLQQRNLDNVVLLCPSPELVSALPHGKISDRTDFKTFPYQERVPYWQKVLDQSRFLADDFSSMVENGTGLDAVRPIDSRPGR